MTCRLTRAFGFPAHCFDWAGPDFTSARPVSQRRHFKRGRQPDSDPRAPRLQSASLRSGPRRSWSNVSRRRARGPPSSCRIAIFNGAPRPAAFRSSPVGRFSTVFPRLAPPLPQAEPGDLPEEARGGGQQVAPGLHPQTQGGE